MKHKRQAKAGASAAAAALQERDSFQVALQHAAWTQHQQGALDMQPAAGLPQPAAAPHGGKGAGGRGLSDVCTRRDNVDLSWTGGAAGLPPQTQQLSGSDAAGAAAPLAAEEEAPVVPVKRARGRQRKNTGVETAQQRAHRRFYQRKKERMGALEQEHRDKLAQVNELLAINAELRRKHEALERAVAGNDEHITLIQALGSLSIKARGRQAGAGAPLDATAAAAQGQADAAAEQQELEQQRRSMPPASRAQSSPVQYNAAVAAAAHPGMPSSDSMGRSESAPAAPPPELMPEVEAAGPFGLVQLPQFGEDDDALLPAATEAAQRGGDSQQQQHEVPSWLAPLQLQDLSMREDGPQQQPGSLLAGMSTLGAAMGLTRSLSLPARTGGGLDALLSPDGLAGEEVPGAGLTGPTPSRCFSATPPAWASRPASVQAGPAAAEAAGQAGWSGFAAVQQQEAYGGAEGGGVPANTRPRSWSGATGSAAEAAAALQQQQEQQLLRPMWGAVTTAGPPLSAAAPQQQQLQQATWQQQQQQQWQAPNQVGNLAQPFAGLPHGLPLEQQLLQPPCAFGATGTPLQPQQQQQQLVQQLQQMGDMAFGSGLALQQQQQQQQQQQFAGGPADDAMLLDDDIMELLQRASQQHSFELLSPLPSIPSALLTGDSMRMVLAAEQQQQGQAGGGGGLDPAAGGDAANLVQQQQPHQQLFGGHDAAAAEGGFSTPPATLLDASRSLQARHRAAGFCPPASSPNEMFYVHELVEWYRTKLQELHLLLPLVDQPMPDVACGVRLIQVMEEVLDGSRKFGARNRIGMWELKLINLETGQFQEPHHAHWRTVADRIQLPPGMRDSALACYTLYLDYVDKVKTERRAVLRDFAALEQQLGAAAAGGGSGGGSAHAPGSLQFRVDGYEAYAALLDRLALSLKREHLVANMLSYSLAQIASHVQMAKGMLACWPYWPDGPSVLSIWLQDEQQLQALGGGVQQQQQQQQQVMCQAGGGGAGGYVHAVDVAPGGPMMGGGGPVMQPVAW